MRFFIQESQCKRLKRNVDPVVTSISEPVPVSSVSKQFHAAMYCHQIVNEPVG
jgi:hypothetical protein